MLLKLLNVDPPEVPWTPCGPSGPRMRTRGPRLGTPDLDNKSLNNLLDNTNILSEADDTEKYYI